LTLDEVRELFAYNAWANRRCFAALEPLPAEAYFRDLKSSHGGLHGTLCHIVWAEQLWLNRWLGKANPAVPQGRDLTTLAAARTRWEAIEAERAAFVAGLSERRQIRTLRHCGIRFPEPAVEPQLLRPHDVAQRAVQAAVTALQVAEIHVGG